MEEKIKYINFKDACKYLCVSDSKLYKMVMKREIPFIKVSRLTIFSIQDLDAYLQEHRVPSKFEIIARIQLQAA